MAWGCPPLEGAGDVQGAMFLDLEPGDNRTESYQLRDDKRLGDQRRSPGQSLETGKSRGEDRTAAQQHLGGGSGRGARQAKETEQETPGKKEDSQEFSGGQKPREIRVPERGAASSPSSE